jgi:alpha-galactosidase
MIVNKPTEKVIAKTERPGDVAVGLFNPTTKPEVISTTASAIGLPGSSHYQLSNLWTHRHTRSGSTISATVPPHGVAYYQVSPIR